MHSGLRIAVLLRDDARQSEAEATARELGLPLLGEKQSGFDLYMIFTEQRLALQLAEPGNGPVSIDFTAGANAHRRRFGGGNGQAMARAVGFGKIESPALLDATGGLARDAFVFASLGANVTLIEQSALLCLLIETALREGKQCPEISDICQRMQLIPGNALEIIPRTAGGNPVDVIYLDPMYPHREKSALVKKEMQLLHRLAGPDENAGDLLDLALQIAGKRVVVKRPGNAPPVSENRLSGSVSSKNTRFDIYAPFRD